MTKVPGVHAGLGLFALAVENLGCARNMGCTCHLFSGRAGGGTGRADEGVRGAPGKGGAAEKCKASLVTSAMLQQRLSTCRFCIALPKHPLAFPWPVSQQTLHFRHLFSQPARYRCVPLHPLPCACARRTHTPVSHQTSQPPPPFSFYLW